MTRAVVFAYHDVGVRCLSVLLDAGVEVALVVTHTDAPGETIWFDSVAQVAARYDIPAVTPDDPNTPEFVETIRALAPDFLFSFYYRQMLKAPLLALPRRGALNMHGSLLPQYRGRVPVNWAIIHGERETGATLHYMTVKPDAGHIVDQQAVPILGDDTAADVFRKVTCAAEITLHRALPGLIAGTAHATPQDLSQGGYFGARRAEHGRIDWSQSASTIHNLIRAVAPPYPGAYTTVQGMPLRILRSRVVGDHPAARASPTLYCDQDACHVLCGGGGTLRILELELDDEAIRPADFYQRYGAGPFPL
ncbi:formyltransferase [Sulfuriferula plumbiphila]|uniref:Formyltransferase n=1 Tax=Sulfuriferula plumbiphila TaxID=171865 RepID=A0A512L521_9PROT|nr:formyltransferase [Sulfuriferula plumbiphila]BBP05442.1 formyltransferase [Sulfuriferula plumbiphila]GEP29261.1 formyltransferase [Sulfuriferula plumbiphila]